MIKQTRGSRGDCLYFQTGHGKGTYGGVGVRQRDLPIRQLYREVKQEHILHMYYATGVTQKTTNLTFCHIPSSDGSKDKTLCTISRFVTTHGVMVKGSSVFTQHVSWYHSCCFNTADNTFIGGCPGWREINKCPSEDKG